MQEPVNIVAQCPTCKTEVSQGLRDPDEIRRGLTERYLYFYCERCDRQWEPSFRDLANVERSLSESAMRVTT